MNLVEVHVVWGMLLLFALNSTKHMIKFALLNVKIVIGPTYLKVPTLFNETLFRSDIIFLSTFDKNLV